MESAPEGFDIPKWSRALSRLAVGTVVGSVFGGIEWAFLALATWTGGALSLVLHAANVLYLTIVALLVVPAAIRARGGIRLAHLATLAVAGGLSAAAWLTLGSA